jgi:hypothetical protein
VLCVVESFMRVKNGEKLSRGAEAVKGTSDVWRGRVDVDVVEIWGRGGGAMDFDAESGELVDGWIVGGTLKGDVEAGGRAGIGRGVEDGWRGGSLPGRGGVGIEDSADIM